VTEAGAPGTGLAEFTKPCLSFPDEIRFAEVEEVPADLVQR
jgi:hypothetical protein